MRGPGRSPPRGAEGSTQPRVPGRARRPPGGRGPGGSKLPRVPLGPNPRSPDAGAPTATSPRGPDQQASQQTPDSQHPLTLLSSPSWSQQRPALSFCPALRPDGAPHPSALAAAPSPSADPVGAAVPSPHARNPRTCPPGLCPDPAGRCMRRARPAVASSAPPAAPSRRPLSSRQPERPRTRRSRQPPSPPPSTCADTPALPRLRCEAPHPRLPPTPTGARAPPSCPPRPPPAVRTVAEKQDQAAAAVARGQVCWRPRLRCGGSESQPAGGLGIRQVLLGLGAGSGEVKRGLRAAPGAGFPSSSGTSVSAPKAFSCGPGPGAWRAACLAQSLRWKHPSLQEVPSEPQRRGPEPWAPWPSHVDGKADTGRPLLGFLGGRPRPASGPSPLLLPLPRFCFRVSTWTARSSPSLPVGLAGCHLVTPSLAGPALPVPSAGLPCQVVSGEVCLKGTAFY